MNEKMKLIGNLLLAAVAAVIVYIFLQAFSMFFSILPVMSLLAWKKGIIRIWLDVVSGKWNI